MNNRQSGFTLIEVLVAVAVAAVLLTTVYGVFGSVSGAKEQVERDAEIYHLARVLCDRLGREIRGTYWRRDAEETVFVGSLDGDQSTLELTTTAASPLGASAAGIAHIDYRLREDLFEGQRRWRLLRREASLFATDFDRQDGQRLSEAVRTFALRYFDGGSWVEEWDAAERGALPRLVEIRLGILDGDRPLSFVTVVDVPLSGGGA